MLKHEVSDEDFLKFVNNIDDPKTLKEAIGLAVMMNNYSLIQSLLTSKKFEYDPTYVIIGIEYDAFETVFLIRSEHPQSFSENEHLFVNSIVTSFSKSNYCWLAKLFLLKQVIFHMSYRKWEELLSMFEIKVAKENPKDNPLYFATNFVLVVLNLYETCILIEKEYPLLNSTVNSLTTYIIGIWALFIKDMKEEKIRSIIYEKDFGRRDWLDIISEYDISDLLNNKNMEKIALELWESQYDIKGTIFECSSSFSILKSNMFSKPRDFVDEYMFYNLKQRNLSKYAHHMCQFQVWMKSMKIKFVVEAIFLFALAVTFQYYLLGAINSGDTLNQAYSTLKSQYSLQSEIERALDNYSTEAIKYYDDMKITVYISVVSFFYPFRIILEIIFAYKTKRNISLLTFSNILDMTFCIVFMYRLVKEYAYYEVDLDNYSQSHRKAIRYYENIYEFNNDEILIDVIYWIGAFCLWVRLLFMFRLTKFLGPLIKMIASMIWEIIIFMILFIIVLIIYSSIGTLLFYTVASYQDFWTTFITLFSAALGNFDFTVLTSQPKGQLTGDLYLASFLILNCILFLNLLVAILTTTYTNFEAKKFVLYISEILKFRSSQDYDKRASGLTSSPPPWNLLSLLMSPFYFTKVNQVKLNTFVLHVCYIPVLLITTLIFIAFNFFIIPFAFLKGIAIKVQFIFYRKSKQRLHRRILSLLVFITLGVFILFLNLCVDLAFFFKHMYQSKIKYKSEKSKSKQISISSFEIIERKVEQELNKGVEAISASEMSIFARDEIKVLKLIQRVVFGDLNNFSDTKPLMDQINDYSLVIYNISNKYLVKKSICFRINILWFSKYYDSLNLEIYNKGIKIMLYNKTNSTTEITKSKK